MSKQSIKQQFVINPPVIAKNDLMYFNLKCKKNIFMLKDINFMLNRQLTLAKYFHRNLS